jgi:hypothetical protein
LAVQSAPGGETSAYDAENVPVDTGRVRGVVDRSPTLFEGLVDDRGREM